MDHVPSAIDLAVEYPAAIDARAAAVAVNEQRRRDAALDRVRYRNVRERKIADIGDSNGVGYIVVGAVNLLVIITEDTESLADSDLGLQHVTLDMLNRRF